MAQSPETKIMSGPGDTAPREDADRRTQAAVNQATAGERTAATVASTAGRHGAAATQETAHEVGQALRHGAAAGSEAAQAGAQFGSTMARRGADVLADGYRQLLDDAAARFEAAGRRLGEAAQETSADLGTLMALPRVATSGVQDLRDSMADLVGGVMQSNLRATQELFRLADPLAIVDLQRRFIRDYLDALMHGTNGLIHAVRRSAEETLRPLEAQFSQHVQSRQDRARPSGDGADNAHGVVADVMTHGARIVTPDDTVQQATRLMRDEDTGVLPVGENDHLVGIVTDRDVALRLVAEGKDPARTKVREVMTQDVKYVYEDEDLGHVAENMAEQQVRRLPVVNRARRVVGVISVGDLTRSGRSGAYAGRAMRGIARETGRHMPGAAE